MAGISYYNISEIPEIVSANEDAKMIAIGQVLSLNKDEKFLSIIMSDTTATAQATLYQRKSDYEQMQLPHIGDTIQVLGTCSVKPMANEKKLFLKIRIFRWRKIDFQEQLQIIQKTMKARQSRMEKKQAQQVAPLRKKPRIKQKIFTPQEMVDIRSLIFSYFYIIFQSNNDIKSYVFMPMMIKNHQIVKEYIKQKEIHQKSMQQAIVKNLAYMLQHDIIQNKVLQPGEILTTPQPQYVIKKRFFQRLVVDIQQAVFDRKATGTTLQIVTQHMNQKIGKYKQEEYVFNFKFIQKILLDLVRQFRIYKTSDKKIYPYGP